jgi:hypothetical protein
VNSRRSRECARRRAQLEGTSRDVAAPDVAAQALGKFNPADYPRQPSGPQDRIRGFVAEGFAKSLFYMQSRERKIAWLSERGLKEDFVGPGGYFGGKVKVSPVTVFAQVLPAGEKALDPGFKHFSFHAVRREDGKLFAL